MNTKPCSYCSKLAILRAIGTFAMQGREEVILEWYCHCSKEQAGTAGMIYLDRAAEKEWEKVNAQETV